MKIIKNFIKIIIITVICIISTVFLMLISIPFINNNIAATIKKDLEKLPLPENTAITDSISYIGHINGSGGYVSRLGAIIIKSELTLEELEAYYSQYRTNDWDCLVTIKYLEYNIIENIARLPYGLRNEVIHDNHYIVYGFGTTGNSFIEDILQLDFRRQH